MSKQYICTGTWRRNNKGDIISEFEYNKMPIEAKEHNYKEYISSFPISQSIEIVNPRIDTEPNQVGTLSDLKNSWKSSFNLEETE